MRFRRRDIVDKRRRHGKGRPQSVGELHKKL